MASLSFIKATNNYYQNYKAPRELHWTKLATECYQLGCNCAKCSLYNLLETKCQMKKTVIALVRELGRPNSKNKEL